MVELPPMIKQALEYADVFVYNSPIAETWKLDIPKYPLLMMQKTEDLEKIVSPLPKSMREGVGILWHSSTFANINFSIALCNTRWHMNIFMCRWVPDDFKFELGTDYTVHRYEEYEKYIQKLSKCYVVLEDNERYYGVSRVSGECATLRIPVVGSTNNMLCKILYPYTLTNPENVQLQLHLITRLYEDQEFYDKVVDYAYDKIKHYFSDGECQRRFIEVLKSIGGN